MEDYKENLNTAARMLYLMHRRDTAEQVRAAASHLESLEAEIKRLSLVVADYCVQISEAKRKREAEESIVGKPMGWIVFEPRGEVDYWIFADEQEATDKACDLANDSDHDEQTFEVIPLYSLPTRAFDKAEIKRLGEIVEKLPRTADGVPVTPKMRAWYAGSDDRIASRISDTDDTLACKCYSTREALESAIAASASQTKRAAQ